MNTCQVCGGVTRALYSSIDENRRISSILFSYARCVDCGTVSLTNPPTDLARYYGSDYYDIPSLERLDAVARKDCSKLDIVKRFKRSGRLLEVGPAYGIFSWQAKSAGFDVHAIEMDSRCCSYLANTLGVTVTQSDQPHVALNEIEAQDVIVLWHVFEHLREPLALLRAAASNLAHGGILILGVPNPDSWQFSVMGKHWPHLDAPRHLNFLPEHILSTKASELGLTRVFFTTDDTQARGWNTFGWQHLLMNRFSSALVQRAMLVFGYALATALRPLDRRPGKGSAYTVVYEKRVP